MAVLEVVTILQVVTVGMFLAIFGDFLADALDQLGLIPRYQLIWLLLMVEMN